MPHRKKGGVPELPFETARERDLYQYATSLTNLIAAGQTESTNVLIRYYQPSSSPRFALERVPRSSYDTTLSSFAQLATLRLNTRRALISLIDQTNQYIIAEATQTLSLQSDSVHNDQDELWFGCTTLPRSQGLCEKALKMLPSSKSLGLLPLIINDLTKDDEFKGLPFVTSRPSLRFYAAMPISTKAGFNIGSLCVMDDKPRDGMSDVEIRFLGDMAITIMAHLETGKVKEEHRRSGKMVKGLGVFVEGGSTLREEWLEVGNDKAWEQHGSKDGAEAHSNEEHISATKTTGSEVAGGFESLDNPSPLPQPKPAVDTLAMAQVESAVELPPPLATQRGGDEISTAPSLGNRETHSFPTPVSSDSAMPDRTQDASSIRSTGEDQLSTNSSQSSRGSTAGLQETMLSENLKEMFSRASNIIRECIEVDGTIFLDASIGTFGGDTGESDGRLVGLGQSGSIEGQSQESIQLSSEGEHSLADGAKGKRKICGILGFSTKEKCSLEGDEVPRNYVPVAEVFLQRLLHKYPRGQVFNLGEGGPVISRMNDTRRTVGDLAQNESRSFEANSRTGKPRGSSKQTEAKALLQMLPGARTVALSPLWDSHRERWFAGSFAWTTRSTRVLTRAEDLSYLAAFGNSIMAEVARLDTMAADQAKSDFISSISHELRSPLHGILASVEFLQDTGVDLFQNSMIDTIERCGRTLLDTIQHVLDFAKINNFTKPKGNTTKNERSSHQKPNARKMGLSVDIDISVVTEDVIDAVYAGYEFHGNSSLGVADEASGFPSEGLRRSNDSDTVPDQPPDQPVLKKERLAIIMDIDWRSNWTFNTQSGALRRVLMNLFGNALKYTDAGWVKVSLQSKDIKPVKSQSQQSIVTITISDSGRGISQEFLHSQLYTPFSQENSLNPGTGLGLSIVLQIVRSLGGTIDVHSELGVGTEVKVSLTLNQAPIPPPPLALDAKYENSVMGVRKKTSGLTLGLVGFDVYSGISGTRTGIHKLEPEPSLSLKASLESMATLWFGMKVTASESWEASPPDIYMENESESSLESLGSHFTNLK
jgi:signal transduction histidine kinase